MPAGYRDFREFVTTAPGLRRLGPEGQAKAVYLKDKHTLPDVLKRLFDSVTVLRLPMEEEDDVSNAMSVANGEVASVSLGLRGDTLHYVRKSLAMFRDRDISLGRHPRGDPFDGEVLPHLDGFELDLSLFGDVDVDPAHGIVRAGVAATWSEVFGLCRTKGWILPLFPALPLDPYMGDIVAGTSTLSSYRGGPGRWVRNVDFVGSDSNYGEAAFDQVPNNAAGYDLNALLLMMGDDLAVPISLTLSLLPSPEDLQAVRYTLPSAEALFQGLTQLGRLGVQPVRVAFGDTTGSSITLGATGLVVELLLHGTEDTLPPQVAQVDAAFGEGVEKAVEPWQPLGKPRPVSTLAELRSASVDVLPLWHDLAAWAEGQEEGTGLVGSLHEGGTVTLTPFASRSLSRGERFDRVLELLEVGRPHDAVFRTNHLLQLLTSEPDQEQRFAVARRIKEGVDLPFAVNPSRMLWVSTG